jgi:precorrin isomerase
MFGNNSCGTHSLVYGSTRHHVIACKGLLSDGTLEDFKNYRVGELEDRFGFAFWKKEKHETLIERIYAQLINFAFDEKTAKLIADNYPDKELQRRSCGYAIDESLPPRSAEGRLQGKNPSPNGEGSNYSKGQSIMMESFRTIEKELKQQDYPLDHKWALLHAIHTTADFDMEDILYTDDGAVETLYNKVKNGELKTIITDVTMVTSGIRKGALQRLGIEAKCYLQDARVAEFASANNITRTQAGIRLAVEEHPDALFAFGNAPTALMELCDLIRKGKVHPAGIIAAPVGFVHVKESKHMVKPFKDIPKIIVEGRKGGSNLAATLCNAILTFDDAAQLKPGRDL